MTADIHDYLLEDADWQAMLQAWAFALPAEFTMWFANRFGDPFLLYDDGSVHRLLIDLGRTEKLADNREAFAAAMDAQADDWLALPLVDRCVAAGRTLAPGRCYGFKIPPVLGGSYGLDNIVTISITERLAWAADLQQQIADVPDGGKVRLLVGAKPT